jgi:hypothetical protein
MPMPIAKAPYGALFPAPPMETQSAPASSLVTHLAGVSSMANHSVEPAPLTPHGAHASSTGQSNFSRPIAPLQAMTHLSAGRVMHALGQHASAPPLGDCDADALAPAKRAHLIEAGLTDLWSGQVIRSALTRTKTPAPTVSTPP